MRVVPTLLPWEKNESIPIWSLSLGHFKLQERNITLAGKKTGSLVCEEHSTDCEGCGFISSYYSELFTKVLEIAQSKSI